MTYEELVREYIKLFILIMETVGQDIGNKVYREVKSIIDEDGNLKNIIDQEPPFYVIVGVLILSLVCKIHDPKDLEENPGLLQSLLEDMWERYLKVPSNKFFRKQGLPTVNTINENVLILLKKYERK